MSLLLLPQISSAEQSSQGPTSKVLNSDYELKLWRKMLRNWAPPRDSDSCKKPGIVLNLHKSGLVLSADLARKSDCESLNKSCLDAVWFAAPYGSFPEGMNSTVMLYVTLRAPAVQSYSKTASQDSILNKTGIEVMQTPGVKQKPIVDFVVSKPAGMDESIANLKQSKVDEVDKYFNSKEFPQSIPFVISKNLWMRVEKYRTMRVKDREAISQFMAALPAEWVGDVNKDKRALELQASLDNSLDKGIAINSNSEFCKNLAELMEILVTSSTKGAK